MNLPKMDLKSISLILLKSLGVIILLLFIMPVEYKDLFFELFLLNIILFLPLVWYLLLKYDLWIGVVVPLTLILTFYLFMTRVFVDGTQSNFEQNFSTTLLILALGSAFCFGRHYLIVDNRCLVMNKLAEHLKEEGNIDGCNEMKKYVTEYRKDAFSPPRI
jgi:hypothetical protein